MSIDALNFLRLHLSLNAKVDLHDLVLPMTMSLDKLVKAGHAHGGQ
jgi:hypothetical protein